MNKTIKKQTKPGDMFNKFQAKKKKYKMLRSGDAVVRSEQSSSHQFTKPTPKKGVKVKNTDMPSVKMKKKGGKKKMKLAPKKKIKKAPAKKFKTAKKGGDSTTTSPKTSTASKTATETSTKTATSTEAFTQGNITVTGGAGKGATIVHIGQPVEKAAKSKTGTSKVGTAKAKK